jgi:hypothetical protein
LTSDLSQKQKQFNAAMELFNSKSIYKQFGRFVSIVNLSLQIYLLLRIWPYSIGVGLQAAAILVAYPVTDFLNGLVHMYMDNNEQYESPAGPLIANFHMHHKIPRYSKNNLLVVYFQETGSKVWLIGYLLLVVLLLEYSVVGPVALYTLVYIGILSSVAEVSHYLCHTSTSSLSIFLGNVGLLLSKQHHASHHLKDNNGYAFLNGFTDPLLDPIAAKFSKGYKNHTDLHFACYYVQDAESR